MEPLEKVELMLLNQSNIASILRRLFAEPGPIERLRLTSVCAKSPGGTPSECAKSNGAITQKKKQPRKKKMI
jgi:hypothetical protein